MNSIECDTQARHRALDPHSSFIVQAPAGSGKTELLTQRLLALLAVCDKNPEEVVAITFTKKAAHEMRERVLQALLRAKNDPQPELAHQQKTWQLAKAALFRNDELQWNLLKNPNRLRIMTIDALCMHITLFAPIISQLGSHPKISDNPALLYRQSAERLLQHPHNDTLKAATRELLLHLDNRVEYLIELFCHLLAKRDQWLPFVMPNYHKPERLLTQLENTLDYIIQEALSQLDHCLEPVDRHTLVDLAQQAGQYCYDEDPHHTFAALKDIGPHTAFDIEQLPLWQAFAGLLLTQQDSWRKSITKRQGFAAGSAAKKHLMTLFPSLQQSDELLQALMRIKHSPSPLLKDEQKNILGILLQLLPALTAELTLCMQSQSQVDFTETTLAALRAFGDDDSPSDLALSLDYQIKHLLVDEFQDTSSIQFCLFEKLTREWLSDDGRSLFLVGDPMQSIYRFRNAEVNLFLQAKQHGINHIHLESLQLNRNFRSQQPITDWVNQSFSYIMPQHEDINSGAIRYHAAIANDSNNDYGCYYYSALKNHSTVAAIVKNIIANTDLKDNSMAILVRSRKQVKEIIPLLKQHNIDFNAVDIQPLSQHPAIQDLFSLTRALLHREDRIAWYAILRAPWCGLALKDLHSISQHIGQGSIFSALGDSDCLNQLSDDGRLRVQSVYPPLQVAIDQLGRQTLHRIIKQCWHALGAEQCLLDDNAMDYCDDYFQLLLNLESQPHELNSQSLQTELSKLYANSSHATANLQIMTIHKSKGLEFDHVILPHLEQRPSHNPSQLLHWYKHHSDSEKSQLLLAPIKSATDDHDAIYNFCQNAEKNKLELESSRLLYVACTRAKKSLHLVASLDMDEKSNEIKAPPKGSHLAQLWPLYQQTFIDAIEDESQPELKADSAPTVYRRPHSSLSTQRRAVSAGTIEQASPLETPLHSSAARITGSVIHECLQQITQQTISSWQSHPIEQQQQQWHKRLRQLGLHQADEITAAISQINACIKATLQSQQGQWLLANTHDFAASEFELSYQKNGKVRNCIIDRFIIADNTAWIIDYKTAKPPEDKHADFIQQQVALYRPQLECYQKVISAYYQLPTRLALFLPLCTPQWVELEHAFELIQ